MHRVEKENFLSEFIEMAEEKSKSQKECQKEYITLDTLLTRLGQRIGRGEADAIHKPVVIKKTEKGRGKHPG